MKKILLLMAVVLTSSFAFADSQEVLSDYTSSEIADIFNYEIADDYTADSSFMKVKTRSRSCTCRSGQYPCLVGTSPTAGHLRFWKKDGMRGNVWICKAGRRPVSQIGCDIILRVTTQYNRPVYSTIWSPPCVGGERPGFVKARPIFFR